MHRLCVGKEVYGKSCRACVFGMLFEELFVDSKQTRQSPGKDKMKVLIKHQSVPLYRLVRTRLYLSPVSACDDSTP